MLRTGFQCCVSLALPVLIQPTMRHTRDNLIVLRPEGDVHTTHHLLFIHPSTSRHLTPAGPADTTLHTPPTNVIIIPPSHHRPASPQNPISLHLSLCVPMVSSKQNLQAIAPSIASVFAKKPLKKIFPQPPGPVSGPAQPFVRVVLKKG